MHIHLSPVILSPKHFKGVWIWEGLGLELIRAVSYFNINIEDLSLKFEKLYKKI